MPGDRTIAAIFVILLVLIMIPWRHTGGVKQEATPTAQTAIDAPEIAEGSPEVDTADQTEPATPDDDTLAAQSETPPASDAGEVVIESDTPVPPPVTAGAILPEYRILSYYGFPGDPMMGILGEHEMDQLLGLLQDQAAEYEAADPSKSLKLAFEIIATVAQRSPGDDGNYLAGIANETIQEYVDFTAENDMLLILDMQFGRNTVQQEIDSVRQWLEYPHVHLALDPEFAVQEGEVPGEVLGQIDASDVTYAQQELAQLSAELDIPPKLLIVHQFNLSSITNRETIEPVSGVQFVLEVDGWGPPHTKVATYDAIIGSELIEYHGFKLWYTQDEPLMTPEEVLALEPVPDLVIYQ